MSDPHPSANNPIPAVALRTPNQVMRLARLGSFSIASKFYTAIATPDSRRGLAIQPHRLRS